VANKTPPLGTYVVHCLDKPDTQELRDANLVHHRAYLASQPLRILLAGPVQTEDRSRSIGSFIFIEAESLDAAREFSLNDPFFKLGLWQSIEIYPFAVARHAF
jgi:uncharacterized protein YciI